MVKVQCKNVMSGNAEKNTYNCKHQDKFTFTTGFLTVWQKYLQAKY